MSDQKLTDIQGIGPKTADRLRTLGIDSVQALSAASAELIATIPGFFASRAEAVKTAAAEMVGQSKSKSVVTTKKGGTKKLAAKKAAAKKKAQDKKPRRRKKPKPRNSLPRKRN